MDPNNNPFEFVVGFFSIFAFADLANVLMKLPEIENYIKNKKEQSKTNQLN